MAPVTREHAVYKHMSFLRPGSPGMVPEQGRMADEAEREQGWSGPGEELWDLTWRQTDVNITND